MALPVKDFPALIRWLADTRHDGVILQMAGPTGISQAMLHRWANGQYQSPVQGDKAEGTLGQGSVSLTRQ